MAIRDANTGPCYRGVGQWDRQFRPFCIEWNLFFAVDRSALRITFELRRNKTPEFSEEINIRGVNRNILKHLRLLLQYRN